MKTYLWALFLIPSIGIYSQSIEETLSYLSSDAATEYSQPAVTAFGSNMSSGWFTGLPPTSTVGFHARLRFVGVGSLFTDDVRRFSTTGQFQYTSQQANDILIASGLDPSFIPNYDEIRNELLNQVWDVRIEGPTITGSANEFVTVEFPGTTIQGVTINPYVVEMTDVKGFLNNSDMLPTPALQLDLSGFIGTGVSVRYFSGVNISNLGKMNVWGAGFVHNINYWFEDPIPIDIGFGYYFQRFDIGDSFKNTASQLGLYISKSIGTIVSIVPYMGLTYESSKSKLDYDYRFDTPTGPQEINLSIDYEGENLVGLTVGATIIFPVISLNFDYKVAQSQTGTIGIGFGF
ncbi:MAG: hypothetical protein HKP17_08390 [Ignavibacteriaceae bacterium]|nr:hypothetical protein [Ignavibacteria bacterium]NNJ53176.1 hypothetical protein [Ignavibacteriaceae bacterium]